MKKPDQKRRCDVCIIGAGPAGLATLSAIREPYTLDTLSGAQVRAANASMGRGRRARDGGGRRVCVVDPGDGWLAGWSEDFERLGIEFLRSPAMAHPDHFDVNALLAYAVARGREDELIESGCAKIRNLYGLGQTQVGLWKLPSTSLFKDFCIDLARRLTHDYIKGRAVDVIRTGKDENSDETEYTVTLADGSEIVSASVVLALGPAGTPVVPPGLCGVTKDRLIPWRYMRERLRPHHKNVLVVGGGLTAVQAAQYCLRQGRRAHLCSRRPLVERHFDIDVCWFDKRSANKHVSDFYHLPEVRRLEMLREVRGGGSVPPVYMEDVRRRSGGGGLTLVDGVEPEFLGSAEDGRVRVSLGKGRTPSFDCVILACGAEPDCEVNPLVKRIQKQYPVRIVGGFPSVSVDLEWTGGLFAVGALASLNVGPDGGNIMGARRAAAIVAGALGRRSWLREGESQGALSNPFELFGYDEESSSSDSDDG